MKKFITILLLSVCTATVCKGACAERIKIFYTEYLNNILNNPSKNEALCRACMTEELIAKMERVGYATGADPVIRAQDANQDALETLTVKELGNDWYLVTYLWEKRDDRTLTQIPVKAHEADGRCRITYITPEWSGSRYGDELLPGPQRCHKRVDQTSEQSFLESFYDAYTAAYCAMPADLEAELAALRERSLSQRALAQFGEAETENEADGWVGYDRLIGHYDFDCVWRPSLRVTPAGDHRYRITYQVGGKTYTILISVQRSGDGYRIDEFQS